MNHINDIGRRIVCGALLVLAIATFVFADETDAKRAPAKPSDNYDELYERYLAAARSTPEAVNPADRIGWMTALASDPRARNVNDLITVRVIENIVAVGSADSSLTKDSTADISLPKFFGIETKLPDAVDPTSLVSHAANTDFKGGGTTSRSGELTATITARVVEVLPNGDLVVEGVREIDINGDRQIVVLTGVVRPLDISRNNVVLSPAVGQLRIRYFGRGLIKDNLKPGWLVRVLNKIF